MGDTGSMAFGGAIATFAIMTKTELLLLLIGGIFVIEALSVMIQVFTFKYFGRRVFLMAPIHHHFEMKAWSETKIMVRFWIVAGSSARPASRSSTATTSAAVSTTALVLGVDGARTFLAELGDFDEIVVLDSDVGALEALVAELADPRLDYMLGGLPVLPLPDASVDVLVGADPADPEVVRVLRPGGRVVPK